MLTGGPQGAEFGCEFCGFVVVSELNEPEIPAPKNVIILLRERERQDYSRCGWIWLNVKDERIEKICLYPWAV